MQATLPNMVDTLRQAHPSTPIALVSRLIYSQVHRQADARDYHERQRDICMSFYCERRQAGDRNLHFIDGNSLIPYGADLAYSDAGVHPSNTGFQLMAERIAPQIEYILFAAD